MKIPNFNSAIRRYTAFTLVEVMISSGVFVLLMTAIIYTYLLAINLQQTDQIKLGAGDDARKALVDIVQQVRSANKIRIGEGNLTNFIECATNALQCGNAMQICPTNTNSIYIQYFYDTNAASSTFNKLVCTSSTNYGVGSLVIGHSMTNSLVVFSAEDSFGNPLSNNLNNCVIGMNLQFFQIEYPIVNIGPGNYYQYYALHTRINRRILY